MMFIPDPSDLNEMRPSNPPLTLWRNMIVSNVHHEEGPFLSPVDELLAERVVMDLIERLEGVVPPSSDLLVRSNWERRPVRSC